MRKNARETGKRNREICPVQFRSHTSQSAWILGQSYAMKMPSILYCAAAVAALLLVGCATLPEVTKIGTNPPSESTVVYWLPRTQLVASVPVKQTELQRAPLLPDGATARDKYYEKLKEELQIDRTEVQLEDQTIYEAIAKDVTLVTRGIRDPDARFEASLKAGFWQDLSLTLEFSEDQFLQSAEIDVTNQTFPTALKVITTAAEVMALAGKAKTSTEDPVQETINRIKELRGQAQ
ncbi:MAG TPA: hypothetical protein VFJ90_03405, partial [Candidatus Didemnitutus sp.]|nr:hypothetical protein [Candidatus Didemnitutus sp.]